MFGIINDIYVAYFNLDYSVVDWFILSEIPSSFLFGLLMAVVIYKKALIKKLAIAMAASLVFTCVCNLAAYISPPLFPLIFIGQLILGATYVLLEVVSVSCSLSWFPEHQVGFALAITGGVGNRFGSLLGIVLPSNIFVSSPQSVKNTESQFNFTANQNLTILSHFESSTRIKFIAFSLSILLLSIIIIAFFIVFYKEKPPQPPTVAQALLPSNQNDLKWYEIFQELEGFRLVVKQILLNKLVLQIILCSAVLNSCIVIEKMLMGEIFRSFFTKLGYLSNANAMSGAVLILFEIGAFFGSFLSGKIVDRYKNYQQQIQIALLLTVFVGIANSVSFHFRCVPAVFVCSILYGFLLNIPYVQYFEITFQHMYPLDNALLSVIICLSRSFGTVIITESNRLILNNYGGIAVFISIIIVLILSFLNSLFLNPKYKRLEASLACTTSNDEDQPLITED